MDVFLIMCITSYGDRSDQQQVHPVGGFVSSTLGPEMAVTKSLREVLQEFTPPGPSEFYVTIHGGVSVEGTVCLSRRRRGAPDQPSEWSS